MAVTKKIEIDGQMVEFRASAAVPRLYRIKFGRDIYKDLRSLEKSVGDGNEESSSLDLFSLEMFENIAYIMAKHAHPDQVPDTPDEWLENFNTFSIYQILPQLIELWGLNVQTEVEAKKPRKSERVMTTSLFMLRCVQLGISIADLDLLTIGLVNDMFTERQNDEYPYQELASQADFDRFGLNFRAYIYYEISTKVCKDKEKSPSRAQLGGERRWPEGHLPGLRPRKVTET